MSKCQVLVKLQSYEEKIWCDVLPMGISSIILGRPWLYDHDATLHGRTNTCTFNHMGRNLQSTQFNIRIRLKEDQVA